LSKYKFDPVCLSGSRFLLQGKLDKYLLFVFATGVSLKWVESSHGANRPDLGQTSARPGPDLGNYSNAKTSFLLLSVYGRFAKKPKIRNTRFVFSCSKSQVAKITICFDQNAPDFASVG